MECGHSGVTVAMETGGGFPCQAETFSSLSRLFVLRVSFTQSLSGGQTISSRAPSSERPRCSRSVSQQLHLHTPLGAGQDQRVCGRVMEKDINGERQGDRLCGNVYTRLVNMMK